MRFELHKTAGEARRGTIHTAHGDIQTPIFMPVGTRAAVKTLTRTQLKDVGAEIILGNTYHLMLRPGADVIEEAGGLHKFMGWDRPILTDSGGFQVFSLAKSNKITDEGVRFNSHIDGSRHWVGPEESMHIQRCLGSDIVMAFDQCPPYPCSDEQLKVAVDRSIAWAKVCREYSLQEHQALFGIVQGGVNAELRAACAKELVKMDFDGYAIGGLSVGEPAKLMYQAIEDTVPSLPSHKPRYLMGVGTPRNLVEAVARGIDMFDCVMPTRNARNGTAFTWQGKIHICNGKFSRDHSPLDPELDNEASCLSKSYIRHLLNVDEITGLTLVSIQNVAFYLDFMKKLRQSIENDTFQDFYERIVSIYPV